MNNLTPDDPGAIDLDKARTILEVAVKWAQRLEMGVDVPRMINDLIAEVVALRARVAELEPLVKDGVRRSLNCQEWQSRAEAAEAHAAVLAGALTFYQADDERSVEGGILGSVFDRPATAALAKLDALGKEGP